MVIKSGVLGKNPTKEIRKRHGKKGTLPQKEPFPDGRVSYFCLSPVNPYRPPGTPFMKGEASLFSTEKEGRGKKFSVEKG